MHTLSPNMSKDQLISMSSRYNNASQTLSTFLPDLGDITVETFIANTEISLTFCHLFFIDLFSLLLTLILCMF